MYNTNSTDNEFLHELEHVKLSTTRRHLKKKEKLKFL